VPRQVDDDVAPGFARAKIEGISPGEGFGGDGNNAAAAGAGNVECVVRRAGVHHDKFRAVRTILFQDAVKDRAECGAFIPDPEYNGCVHEEKKPFP